MRMILGRLLIEGDAHRSGFDFSLALPRTNEQFGYTLHRAFFAIWFARGWDAGVMVGRWEFRRNLFPKVHLAVSCEGFSKGSTITGHLCGREHSANDTENNSALEPRDVTCGHCLKILATPNHWRLRRYGVKL